MHSHSGACVAVEYSLQDIHIRSRQARQLAPLLIIRPSSARHRAQQCPDHRLDSHRNTSNSPLVIVSPRKKQIFNSEKTFKHHESRYLFLAKKILIYYSNLKK